MKRLATFHWVIIVVSAAAIIAVAFVYFRNGGPTYTQVDRSTTIHYANGAAGGRSPSTDAKHNDATLGVILPYLATPH